MRDRPWSNRQMEIVGRCIRDHIETPADCPDYNDVMLWYDDLTAEVKAMADALPWRQILPQVLPSITERTKTIDTLRDKLGRLASGPLHSIVDISGVRIDAEMTTIQQDAVADAVVAAFGPERCSIKDLRDGGHSGYRAVHVHVKHRRARAEIQIRTELQSKWANTYERLGDVAGRQVRYGEPAGQPEWQQVVASLQSISRTVITEIEEAKCAFSLYPGLSDFVWDDIDRLPDSVKAQADAILEQEGTLSTMLDDIERDLTKLARKG